jgi:hypothetical protein
MPFFPEDPTHEFEQAWDHLDNQGGLDGFSGLPEYRPSWR